MGHRAANWQQGLAFIGLVVGMNACATVEETTDGPQEPEEQVEDLLVCWAVDETRWR